MGRRRGGKYSGFADGFSAGYDAVSRIADDYDKMQVRKTINDGLSKSKEEAAASGGTVSTLDKGLDSTAPDYASKNKSDIDMIAGQEDAISSMQSEIDTQKNPPPAVETMPLADAGRPQGMDIGLAEVNDARRQPPAMPQAPAATAGLQPTAPLAPAPVVAAPEAAKAPAPGYTRAEVQTAKVDAMDIFHKKYAPDVIGKLMSQGKVAEATAFEDWSNSAKGKSYGKVWMGAVQKEQMGDHPGALKDLQELYNKQLPDGQYATINTDKEGKSTVEVRDEKSHKLVNQFAAKAPDLTQALLGMGSPDKAWTFLQGQQAAASTRQEKVADAKQAHEYKLAENRATAELKPEATSGLAKAQNDLRNLKANGGSAKEISEMEDYIDKLKTTGGGNVTNVNVGSTPYTGADGNQYVIESPKAGGSAKAVPVKGGLSNPVDQAYNALEGVTYEKPPGGVGKMYVRDGQPLPRAEREAAAKYHDTLRKARRKAPWELDPPGLK